MKILHINKFFWQSGGVERYMFEVSAHFRERGHESIFFAMQHPRNRSCAQERYFVSQIEYRDTSLFYKVRTTPKTVAKTVYSIESRRKMEALLQAERPDLAHVHLISHQISPSILPVLKRFGIPVVQTVHEYKRVCPSAQLYIHHKGEICERCLGGNYLHAIAQRCVKGSLAGSTLAAAAQYVHRWSGLYDNQIDRYIAPSRFMARKLAEGGVDASSVRVLPYVLNLDGYAPRHAPGDYALFFGRVSPEKGIDTLLHAMKSLPSLPLRIVGEGPARPALEEIARKNALTQVEFCGYRDGDELKELIRNAAFVVVPSVWLDNSPLVIYEAYALGKPVIASDIGGIPELVEPEVTGLLVPPGDPAALAEAMRHLAQEPARIEAMGRRARERIEGICASHYAGLMEIYAEAGRCHEEPNVAPERSNGS